MLLVTIAEKTFFTLPRAGVLRAVELDGVEFYFR